MNCNLVTSALRQCVLPIVAVSALLLVAISAQAAAGVHFQTLVPSTFGDAATLRVALPLRNVGDSDAREVNVTAVTLQGVGPVSVLNPALGAVDSAKDAVLEVDFTSPGVAAGTRLLMRVSGTYRLASKTFGFSVTHPIITPPPPNGQRDLNVIRVDPQLTRCRVAPCDPIAAPFEKFEPRRQNLPGPPVPTGRFNPPGFSSFTDPPRAAPSAPGLGSSGGIYFTQATTNAPNPATLFSGIPPDMSGASSSLCSRDSEFESLCDTLVLMTGNTFLAYSTDAGRTFPNAQIVRPNTVFSDTPDGGFCCDQVVEYVPSIDRYVWLIQTRRARLATDARGAPATGPNRLRIALAAPASIKSTGALAWTYYDISAATLGIGNNWVDYPDLAVGNNFLYFSVDQVGTGLIVGRLPLADLAAGRSTSVQFTAATDGATTYGGHLSQNALDGVYWAGHNTSDNLRVFRMPESGNQYFWQSLRLPNSWANSNFTSLAPDGLDWLAFGFPRSSVLGATRRGGSFNDVWFAWSAGRDTRFAQPHIELLRLTRNADGSVSTGAQSQIWNATTAFQYPSLASDSGGHLAVALGWGGNSTQYGSFAVGFWGDFVMYYQGLSDLTSAYTVPNNATPPANVTQPRWGDYITVRRAANTLSPFEFAAFGYAVRRDATDRDGCNSTSTGSTGCRYEPQFLRFEYQAPTVR